MTEYAIELTHEEIDRLFFYDATSFCFERPLAIQPPDDGYILREYRCFNVEAAKVEKAYRWVNALEHAVDEPFFETGYGGIGDVLIANYYPKLCKPIRLEILAIDIFKPPQANKFVIGLIVRLLEPS